MSQAATTRPHGDYWAGYRFTPRLIAGARSAVWVVENHLPLLARIDPGSGAVSGPRRVGHGDPAGRGAHDLLADGDTLWIRWNDGITRFHPPAGDERWLDLSAAGLAVGDAGVWALTGDGRLARVDPDGVGFEPVGEPEVRRHSIAVGHGAVWTLTWTHVPGGSTVSRVDPASGRVEGQLPVQGSPRQLMVDGDAIYVRVWRRDSSGRVEESLLGVDPARVEAIAEVRISPAGAGGAVRDGVVWSPDGDLYAHEDRGAPSTARCFDARSGELLDSVEVAGWITAMAPGPGGVWGCLERRGQSGGAVIQLAPKGGTRTIELGDLDVSPHVPS
jgi:outer membrane protein assembly factor BamB